MAYGTYLLSKALDCYNDYMDSIKAIEKLNTSADGWKFARKGKKVSK